MSRFWTPLREAQVEFASAGKHLVRTQGESIDDYMVARRALDRQILLRDEKWRAEAKAACARGLRYIRMDE